MQLCIYTHIYICICIYNSWSLPKFMSIASVMPSSHLIPWCPLLLLPSIFPSIRYWWHAAAHGSTRSQTWLDDWTNIHVFPNKLGTPQIRISNHVIHNSSFNEYIPAYPIAKSYLTLCDPMDISLPNSSVCVIFQTRVQEWVAISFSRASSQPRDRTHISCIGRQILYHCSTWEIPSMSFIEGLHALFLIVDSL